MIIETNAYLSRWPFRRLAGDETTGDFVARLRKHGVGQPGWGASTPWSQGHRRSQRAARGRLQTARGGTSRAVRRSESEAARLAGGSAALPRAVSDVRHPAASRLSWLH